MGSLNDLWEFNPSTNKWAWMGGSSIIGNSYGQSGVYGTLGVPASGNVPGARIDASSWTDRNGYFWLFGGYGVDAYGNIGLLNDLWEFDPSSNEWAWMSGSSTVGVFSPSGVYGTLGVPASGNVPGGRSDSSNWTDVSGHLWLYGGSGFDANGDVGFLDDVWEFDPSTNEWAWMKGENVILPSTVVILSRSFDSCASNAVYGTLGMPAAGDSPGGVEDASSWIDSNGKFWLFGGQSGDSPCVFVFNDVWEFDPSMNEWAWMDGSDIVYTIAPPGSTFGEYGILGVPASGNTPGGRYSASSWTDSGGHLWLFGGYGSDATGNVGYLNDLWEFQPVAPYTPTATPIFDVGTGTSGVTPTVIISDATPGAVIYYTTDGVTTPTTNSTQYTGPITVSATETIQAIAVALSYTPSPVVSLTYTLNPDFTVSASPASITVTAGRSGAATVIVTPLYAFKSAVTFSCSGLPTGASCSFSPSTVTPPGTTSTTLTVTTAAKNASLYRDSLPLLPGSALAAALCCFGFKKRRRLQIFLLLAVSVVGLGLLTSCGGGGSASSSGGGGGGSQPVISTVTVTATSGSLTHTTTFTLTVN
jgi:N-acetylneuraminic acid mutarotase